MKVLTYRTPILRRITPVVGRREFLPQHHGAAQDDGLASPEHASRSVVQREWVVDHVAAAEAC